MKKNFVFVLVLYLLGLFMGALDTGIVAPARSVIQNQLGVSETIGIWMITIFTLAYAVSIPISGKLADIYGRKRMYLISIFLFGFGSLICALSSSYDNFTILLLGRVIQAIGGGGIMPIVTAEIGTSFPEEKRGIALGLVGGIYGIANILGSSAGSFILDLAGNAGWHWLFLINVPISIFILVGAWFTLENHKVLNTKPIDGLGILFISMMILSLMYGLTNIEFNNIVKSIESPSVWPFLLLFVILIPIFVWIERKAEDPVLNLKYFMDPGMLTTFGAALITGLTLMGMVFIPQFAENTLKIRTGAGGYFVTALGLFSGIGAPLSGKIIDKYGAKVVLIAGFSASVIGSAILAFYSATALSLWSVLLGLFFMGLGMGFTMGTPLNYMVLTSVPKQESNSALSTLSLVRSIGTSLSPAIMIGFLATAGLQVQDNLFNTIPDPPTKLVIVQTEEIKPLLAKIKEDPDLVKNIDPDMLDIDKMMNKNTNSFQMNSSDGTLPEELIQELQSADVTNITDRVKHLADVLFTDNVTPEVIGKIQNGVQEGIKGIETGITEMNKVKAELIVKSGELTKKEAKIAKSLNGMKSAESGISKGISGLNQALAGMNEGLTAQKAALDKMLAIPHFNPAGATGNAPTGNMPPGIIPAGTTPSDLQASIEQLRASINALEKKKSETQLALSDLIQKRAQLINGEKGLESALKGLKSAKSGIQDGINSIKEKEALLLATSEKMAEIKDAVPSAFDASKNGYLSELENIRPTIEGTFQRGINVGFRNMYIFVGILSFIGILLLIPYKPKKMMTD